MQTLTDIRALLEAAGLTPHRRFGQNFLIDQNLMARLLDLADVQPGDVVLEVGPGTGSLTEELLARAARVVAVEIDRGFARMLGERFAGQDKLTLIGADALVGKHAIEPAVLAAVGPRAVLVANLPYNIATPLVAQCLIDSWKALKGRLGATRFDRLTFSVQEEVAQRLAAKSDSAAYGPVSVLIALLGRVELGPTLPATAFWPRPQIVSRMMRIDFDAPAAEALADIDTLAATLSLGFGQRRKQLGSVVHRKNAGLEPQAFLEAMRQAAIDPTVRAERVTPQQFLALANALALGGHRSTKTEIDTD